MEYLLNTERAWPARKFPKFARVAIQEAIPVPDLGLMLVVSLFSHQIAVIDAQNDERDVGKG